MTRRILNYSLVPAVALGILACEGRKKADVAQRAVEVSHNAAQCPKGLTDATGMVNFNAKGDDVQRTFYVRIENDRNAKVLKLDLNGVEKLDVAGKNFDQKNGSKLSAGCVNNAIRVAGKDAKGNIRTATLSLVDPNDSSKGLKVEQSNPEVRDLYYERGGPITATANAIGSATTSPATQQQEFGLPRAEDLKSTAAGGNQHPQPAAGQNQQPPAPQQAQPARPAQPGQPAAPVQAPTVPAPAAPKQ